MAAIIGASLVPSYSLFGTDMMLPNPAQNSQQDVMSIGELKLRSTEVKEYKYTNYIWTIDNFKFHCDETGTGEMIKSPCFSVEGSDTIKWRLDLYPKGRNECSSSFLSIYLTLVSCEKGNIVISCEFAILDCKNVWNAKACRQTIYFKQGTDYGYPKFCNRYYLLHEPNGLLPAGKLTIRCKVSVMVDTVNISGQGDLVENPRACVSDDLGKLFEDKTLSDVTLVTGRKEILRAHKAILAARSAVFAAMFEHDMQEQKLSRVDISDVDYHTLTEMLRYIYTGCVRNIDNVAHNLLFAADKYALDSLKVMCEEALCRNLSVETAADTLVWADLQSAELLKKQTIAFINSRHAGLVMATESWKKMTSTHPHLVAELLSKVTVQLQQHLPIYRCS